MGNAFSTRLTAAPDEVEEPHPRDYSATELFFTRLFLRRPVLLDPEVKDLCLSGRKDQGIPFFHSRSVSSLNFERAMANASLYLMQPDVQGHKAGRENGLCLLTLPLFFLDDQSSTTNTSSFDPVVASPK